MDYIKTIRSIVGHEPIRSVSTGIIIENELGEILLQKRSDNGLYGIPGGSLELDEKIIDGLKEEVFEETGIRVNNPRLIGIYSGNEQAFCYPNGDITFYVSFVFYERIPTPKLSLNEESLVLEFFPKNAIPINITPTDLKCIRKWVSGNFDLEMD